MQPLAPIRAARETFRQVLASPGVRGMSLLTAIEDAGLRHGVEPFRACLALFSLTPRTESEARKTLEGIEAHRSDLEARLQRDPGFAVAVADYLHTAEGAGWHGGHTPLGPLRPRVPPDRPFDDLLGAELRRHGRNGRPLALLLLSPWAPLEASAIDSAATAVLEAARDVDVPARVLPEGIVVLLPCTSGADGVIAARRLAALAARASDASWCAGVASVPGEVGDADSFAAAARTALDQALRERPGSVRLARFERRGHPRRPAGGALRAHVLARGRRVEVAIVDLSLGGALVEAQMPMTCGETVMLSISETTARARRATMGARVLRSESPTSSGLDDCRVALAFDPGEGSLPEITHILAGLTADATLTERR